MPAITPQQISKDAREFKRNIKPFLPAPGNLATPAAWGIIENLNITFKSEEFELRDEGNGKCRHGQENHSFDCSFDIILDFDQVDVAELFEQPILAASAANMTTMRPPAQLQRFRVPGMEDKVAFIKGDIQFTAAPGAYAKITITGEHNANMGDVLTVEPL